MTELKCSKVNPRDSSSSDFLSDYVHRLQTSDYRRVTTDDVTTDDVRSTLSIEYMRRSQYISDSSLHVN